MGYKQGIFDMKYLAKFRQGNGPINVNAIDYYINDKGEIIKHSWAMGGETKKVVDSVPESIAGYIKQ